MSPLSKPSGDPLDPRALRQALGAFATGITVVTARGSDGQLAGVTVNSFASVSLNPPLVLWSLGNNSPSLAVFAGASHYAVNVLAADQQALSQRFATSQNDKFSGLEISEGAGGAALLPGCCAWFECRIVARHPGGDHVILVGEVEAFRSNEKSPLIYFGSGYCTLG
jgi:flavin reductase (DIM6/NTAB) family NADH-FMN oxidoreductase RutF